MPKRSDAPASGALAGLRVVDCSRGTAGLRTTALLADHGADVVWVEPPGGDPCRAVDPVTTAVFARGKRSIVVDLAAVDGYDTLRRLLAVADVLVTSWRPGVAEQLGLDHASLHGVLPGLVCCSITAFGEHDPNRDVPGYEALVHALSGGMAEQRGTRPAPIFQALPYASIGAAYLANIGILAALLRRENDGVGRGVETSLLDGALAYHHHWGDTSAYGIQPEVSENVRLVNRTFLCGDDRYLGIHTGALGAFGRLMHALGLDDRVSSIGDGRDMAQMLTANEKAVLAAELDAIFATKPRAQWVEVLAAADVCAIEMLHPCEAFDEPQARHNDMVLELDDPTLGRLQQVNVAARLQRTPGRVRRAAPPVGAHTDEILAELASARAWRDPAAAGVADDRPLLDGVKVLDLGQYVAGPYCSRLLADLGATVVKLEPIGGDKLRGLDRVFASSQAGKKSVALDLKDPEVQALARRLAGQADLVHHNLRPGAAERLGMGYDDVVAANPGVVYLYAPGWGATGPRALRQSFAPLMSGYVGASSECGGAFNPPMPPFANEDAGNGMAGAVASLLALLHRARFGEGQYVEVPQLNSALVHMAHIVRRASGDVLGAERLDTLQRGFSALERLYETSDGWICIVAAKTSHVRALGDATGVVIDGDERFSTADARVENDYYLGELLADAFATRTSQQWIAALGAAGVPAAVPVGNNIKAFLADPAQRRLGRTAECAHASNGTVRELAVLLRVTDTEMPLHRLAPSLGEHTDEVLRDLGVQPNHIIQLRERGAVR